MKPCRRYEPGWFVLCKFRPLRCGQVEFAHIIFVHALRSAVVYRILTEKSSMLNHAKSEAGYTLLELLYVVSIISLLAALLIPQLLLQRNRVIEAEAQKRLRTIGSVMVDYALTQQDGNYADFQELKDSHLIRRDLTEESIIVDYSLQVRTTDITGGEPPGYTIMAVPRPERSYGRLSTFAITEDNVVRVYKPGPGVDPNDPYTWQPII